MSELRRCEWARLPLDVVYHDTEWGVPVHDDRTHFEFITLEGAQAGLSWSTILKKRERYREVLDGFDPERIARYTRELETSGADFGRAAVVSLAVDGLKMRESMRISPFRRFSRRPRPSCRARRTRRQRTR